MLGTLWHNIHCERLKSRNFATISQVSSEWVRLGLSSKLSWSLRLCSSTIAEPDLPHLYVVVITLTSRTPSIFAPKWSCSENVPYKYKYF